MLFNVRDQRRSSIDEAAKASADESDPQKLQALKSGTTEVLEQSEILLLRYSGFLLIRYNKSDRWNSDSKNLSRRVARLRTFLRKVFRLNPSLE